MDSVGQCWPPSCLIYEKIRIIAGNTCNLTSLKGRIHKKKHRPPSARVFLYYMQRLAFKSPRFSHSQEPTPLLSTHSRFICIGAPSDRNPAKETRSRSGSPATTELKGLPNDEPAATPRPIISFSSTQGPSCSPATAPSALPSKP